MAKTIADIIRYEGINSEGFGMISKLVMCSPLLSIESKTIYSYLCSLAGDKNSAFPKRKTIFGTLNITERRYVNHFNKLLEFGLITVEKNNKFPYNNIYTITLTPKGFEIPKHETLTNPNLKSFGYGTVPRAIMKDSRIPIESKGIYSYFCSRAGNFNYLSVNREEMFYHLGITKSRYYKYFDFLIKYGYVSVNTYYDKSRRTNVNQYILCENPNEDDGMHEYIERKIRHNASCPEVDSHEKDCPENNSIENSSIDKNSINKPFSENDTHYNAVDSRDGDCPENSSIEKRSNNINNININKLNKTLNQSYLINSSNLNENIEKTRNDIKNQINYVELLKKGIRVDFLNSVVELIQFVLTSESETYRVNQANISALSVKKAFTEINQNIVANVFNKISALPGEVKKIHNYMLTCLYNEVVYKKLESGLENNNSYTIEQVTNNLNKF